MTYMERRLGIQGIDGNSGKKHACHPHGYLVVSNQRQGKIVGFLHGIPKK
jgi:hypothetical protein